VNNQSGNVYNYTFPQKFDNRKSYMYQVIYSDEAGNNGVVGTSTNILRMENEDPEATISNNDINVSANGWTNITAQGISIDFSDTG
jgi:hypothetical protein